jgi:hypothetical protein
MEIGGRKLVRLPSASGGNKHLYVDPNDVSAAVPFTWGGFPSTLLHLRSGGRLEVRGVPEDILMLLDRMSKDG